MTEVTERTVSPQRDYESGPLQLSSMVFQAKGGCDDRNDLLSDA